jgi:hypothetical protein
VEVNLHVEKPGAALSGAFCCTREKSLRARRNLKEILGKRRTFGGILLGSCRGMTDTARPRLSLLLAIIGALMMATHLLGDFWLARFSRNLPAFQKSTPELHDWPRHSWDPIG